MSVGQSIGAQNVEDARGFASHNLTIALILSLCWGFLLFVLAHPIIGFYKLEERVERRGIFENRRFRIPIYLPLGGVYRDS